MNSVSQILKSISRTKVFNERCAELKARVVAIENEICMTQKECSHDIVCILGEDSLYYPQIYPGNKITTFCPLCGKKGIKFRRYKEGQITILDISAFPMGTVKERTDTIVSVLEEICQTLEQKKGSNQIDTVIRAIKTKCQEENWPLKVYKATI